MSSSRAKPNDAISMMGLGIASHKPRQRLAISPGTSFQEISEAALSTAIEHLPPEYRIYLCDSVFAELTPSAVLNSLRFRGESVPVGVSGTALNSAMSGSSADDDHLGLRSMRSSKWLEAFMVSFIEPEIEYLHMEHAALLGHRRAIGDSLLRRNEKRSRRPSGEKSLWTLLSRYDYPERRLLRATHQDTEKFLLRDKFLTYACMNAIFWGHHALILTSDPTVLEQFYSLCAVLSQNYHAWIMGRTLPKDIEKKTRFNPAGAQYGWKALPILIKKTHREIQEVLPNDAWPLILQTWYLRRTAAGWKMLPSSFLAECPMLHSLICRANTNGRNTDRMKKHDISFSFVSSRDKSCEPDGCCFIYESTYTSIGSNEFPLHAKSYLPVKRVKTHELILMENHSDPVDLPWHRHIRANPQWGIDWAHDQFVSSPR